MRRDVHAEQGIRPVRRKTKMRIFDSRSFVWNVRTEVCLVYIL